MIKLHPRPECFLTGMFPLPNPLPHMSSTAFAQARLSSAQAYSPYLRDTAQLRSILLGGWTGAIDINFMRLR